jgi:chromosome segregation ATPase
MLTMTESRQRLEAIKAEIVEVHGRLGRLYDALETGKLSLSDLAPRIQSLRQQEDQLQAARLDLEEVLALRKLELVDEKLVKSYVEDLRQVLSDSPLPEQKAFIRSFLREVKVTGSEVLLTYTIPLSPERSLTEKAGVLDTVHYGGP